MLFTDQIISFLFILTPQPHQIFGSSFPFSSFLNQVYYHHLIIDDMPLADST
jgi:hypothetical protein